MLDRVAGIGDGADETQMLVGDNAMIAGCHLSGADRVFKIGGAQAIAALAYGTESVPAVNKIVGPGDAFVNEAKRQVFGPVGIDQLADPSEVFIVADSTGDAEMIATDILAQAEHDVRTRVGLITTDRALAEATMVEVQNGNDDGAVAVGMDEVVGTDLHAEDSDRRVEFGDVDEGMAGADVTGDHPTARVEHAEAR